jgi:non-ribosomal peptide synthetase-like protein
VFATDLVLNVVFSIAYFVLVEWIITAFRALQPQFCSIYDPYYWWHERYWKIPTANPGIFNGTPFKNVIWRLLGVRIGRRVFDDGCSFSEKTLTAIGDDCMLNAGSGIQCHSLEDGIFKSDRTTIGAGCTLGVGTFVHYGVTMGEGSELIADSFLMKGEEIPPHARWGGNPARAMTSLFTSGVVQQIAHQEVETQPGDAHQIDVHNRVDIQDYQERNGACPLVQQRGTARRTLKGGKIRWEN